MSISRVNRRRFLRNTGAFAAAGLTVPYFCSSRNTSAQQTRSPNDRPLMAAVGVGGRGMHIAKWASQFADVVAVCDVDEKMASRARGAFDNQPRVYNDYRRLLDDSSIDVVINATPDHWHTAINVASCQAGKDVYTEKPLTLTIDEGKLLRRVVADTDRVVQVGTQQRSEKQFQRAVELVRNGRLGKLRQVWVVLPYFSTSGGPFASGPVPQHLNWDMYQGQAPLHTYCRQRTHSNFRWWYEYAGGIVTDWGNHHLDIAHWGMDSEVTGPVSIEARALFPNPIGSEYYNTPDRFCSHMAYANGVDLFFFTSLNERLIYGEVAEHAQTTADQETWLFGDDAPEEIKTYARNGIMFIGDRGRVFVNRGGVYGQPYEELAEDPLPEDAWRTPPSTDHMANFFDCCRSRKEPVSPVRIQHRTVTACHLTNISLRLQRKLRWDPDAEQFIGDAEANLWQKREQRHPYEINV